MHSSSGVVLVVVVVVVVAVVYRVGFPCGRSLSFPLMTSLLPLILPSTLMFTALSYRFIHCNNHGTNRESLQFDTATSVERVLHSWTLRLVANVIQRLTSEIEFLLVKKKELLTVPWCAAAIVCEE